MRKYAKVRNDNNMGEEKMFNRREMTHLKRTTSLMYTKFLKIAIIHIIHGNFRNYSYFNTNN